MGILSRSAASTAAPAPAPAFVCLLEFFCVGFIYILFRNLVFLILDSSSERFKIWEMRDRFWGLRFETFLRGVVY